ncbi:hypothetical protein CsatA_021534 [Cannabis sativa]
MEKKEAKIVKKYTKSFEKTTCARSFVGVDRVGRRHGRTRTTKRRRSRMISCPRDLNWCLNGVVKKKERDIYIYCKPSLISILI